MPRRAFTASLAVLALASTVHAAAVGAPVGISAADASGPAVEAGQQRAFIEFNRSIPSAFTLNQPPPRYFSIGSARQEGNGQGYWIEFIQKNPAFVDGETVLGLVSRVRNAPVGRATDYFRIATGSARFLDDPAQTRVFVEFISKNPNILGGPGGSGLFIVSVADEPPPVPAFVPATAEVPCRVACHWH